ncbi:MAG: hemolysin III family protein [Acidimicrobiales bacterium]
METAAETPLFRGFLHFAACIVALPAGWLLVSRTTSTMALVACTLYVSSLLLSFGTSAGYHCLTKAGRARRVMRRLDHAMIYVLIGGTYVPLCLLALPLPWGIPLLATVGLGVVVGAVAKLVVFERGARLAHALYLLLGWAVVVAAPKLLQHLDPAEIILLALGGLAYTVGVPVLIRHRPDPWPKVFGYHEVWHGFTVVAAGLHFAAVVLLAR